MTSPLYTAETVTSVATELTLTQAGRDALSGKVDVLADEIRQETAQSNEAVCADVRLLNAVAVREERFLDAEIDREIQRIIDQPNPNNYPLAEERSLRLAAEMNLLIRSSWDQMNRESIEELVRLSDELSNSVADDLSLDSILKDIIDQAKDRKDNLRWYKKILLKLTSCVACIYLTLKHDDPWRDDGQTTRVSGEDDEELPGECGSDTELLSFERY